LLDEDMTAGGHRHSEAVEVRAPVATHRDRRRDARLSCLGGVRYAPEVKTMLLLKSRHQAIIMAAADPLPPEKRQAFLIARSASCNSGNSVPPPALPIATSPTQSSGY
jgi:hypothetical protein